MFKKDKLTKREKFLLAQNVRIQDCPNLLHWNINEFITIEALINEYKEQGISVEVSFDDYCGYMRFYPIW